MVHFKSESEHDAKNMTTLQTRLTPDELLAMPDGGHFELIDGIPKEKRKGAYSSEVTGMLVAALVTFVRKNRIGHIYGSKTGFRCFPNDTVRKPDIAFVVAGRLKDDKTPEGDIDIAPDLAVDVVSPIETYEDVASKIRDYKSAKIRLIWVISPETKTVLIRRLDGTCTELDESGTLSGEDVLPGFACPVAELFV
jgi:Uma2 family endonuclease